jgi:hypothetical protein
MAITHSVKFTASAKEAISEVQKYADHIVATASTVEKHAASLGGGKILSQANNWTAAVGKIGGATGDLATKEQLLAGASKLTATEKQRVNTILDQAIQKYTALGQTAPTAMRDLYESTKKVPGGLSDIMSQLGPLGPMIAGAFSVGGIQAFLGTVFSVADRIKKMSDQASMSAREIQALDRAAIGSGSSLESLVSASQNLQMRIGSGDDALLGAVKTLGYSLREIEEMSAYEQMQALGGAIATIPDPTQRAALAADVFGKNWKEILPALIDGLHDVDDAMLVMSDGTVARLDEMGDKWDEFTRQLKAVAGEVVSIVPAVSGDFIGFLDRLLDTGNPIAAAIGTSWADNIRRSIKDELAKPLPVVSFKEITTNSGVKVWVMETSKALDHLAGSFGSAGRAAKPLEMGEIELERVTKELTTRALADAERKLEAVAQKQRDWNAAVRESSESMVWLDRAGAAYSAANAGYAGLVPVVQASGAAQLEAARAANAWEAETARLTTSHGGLLMMLPPVIKQSKAFAESVAPTPDFWQRHGESIGRVGETMSGLGRVAEMSGHQTTSALLGIGATMAGLLTQGRVFEAGIAGAVGLITTFGAKLFKTEGKKVNDMRDEFVAAAGGLHELNVKAQAAGLTLDRLLKAKNVTEYEAAVKQLNDAFDAQKNKIEETNRALEEQARIRAEIEGQIDANVAETASLRASLIPAWDEVSGLMQKYGIGLDGAGQKVQALKLLHDSTSIVNDLEKWQRANGDTQVMLDGMADSLIAMANDAKKYGVELPAQMQPLLQALADQGKLVDGNGNKLKDLTGIKFGAPVESEADRINKSIDKLVTSLADLVDKLNKLPGVAENVGKELEESLGEPPWPRGGWPSPFDGGTLDWPTGGRSAASAPPGFANGTGGRYFDFGAGTPVILHGRERVMTEREGVRAGSGGALNLTVYASRFDTTPFLTAVVEDLPGLLDQMGR